MKLDKVSRVILSHIFSTKEITLDMLDFMTKEKCEIILSTIGYNLESFFSKTEFSDQLKGEIILKLVEKGTDIDSIFAFLDWRGFEIIVSSIFDKLGFMILQNFRFKDEFAKYEIDVLAFKFPYLFVIDCKHYARPTASIMKTASIKQKERVETLLEMFPILYDELVSKLNLPIKRQIYLYPLVISWRNHDIQFYQNVPIIAFSQLSGFLQEIDEFRFNIFYLPIKID